MQPLTKPPGWQVRRLKFVSTINDEVLPESTPPDFRISYVDIGDVTSEGQITGATEYRFEQAPSRARRKVRDGDVIVSTVRTYLRAIAPIHDPEPNLTVSTGFAVVRPTVLDTTFAAYALRSPYFVERVVAASTGVSYPAINASALGDLPVLVPPLRSQRAIAAFLDRETAKIDALVEKKRRLLGLLDEKRTALITRAVTRGLDPDVPMKDSGVEWLGEIPAHWEVVALRWISLSYCDGPFGSNLKSEHYRGSGVRVIRLQNIGSGSFRKDNAAFIAPTHEETLGDHRVRAGDLLIAGLGDERHPVGRACVAPEGIGPAIVKADCFRFRLNVEKVVPQFLAYQLSVTAEVSAGALSTGATRSRMNLSTVAGRRLALPPLSEQREIVGHISEALSTIRRTRRVTRRAISLLQEYRTALISAAVTGHIDDPGALT